MSADARAATDGAQPGDASFADEAFAVAAGAYARTPESWEQAVRAAIAALFDFLAEHPAQTTSCVVVDFGASPMALDRRDSLIDRFTELLQPGFANVATHPPAVVAEAIGGGIYELVRRHVLDQRLDELAAAAPHATMVALAPFKGAAGAVKLGTGVRARH